MTSQLGGGIFQGPAPQPVPWRYSMQSNGVSLATYLGDVSVDGAITFDDMTVVGYFNLPDGSEALEVTPVGNTVLPTYGSFQVLATTQVEDAREFAAVFGLYSDKGATEPGNEQDKVTLYAGLDMLPGSGAGWSFNTVTIVHAGVGAKDVHGYELDLNNNNQAYGDTVGSGGLSGATCWGLSVDGFSAYNSTGAILINQANGALGGKWNRGIVFGQDSIVQTGIENYAAMTWLIRNFASPDYVLYSSTASKLAVSGLVGFGADVVAGFAINAAFAGAMLSQLAGTTSAALRLADTGAAANLKYGDLSFDSGVFNLLFRNDDGSLKFAPFGVDTTGANPIIRPSTDDQTDLGATALAWRNVEAVNINARTRIGLGSYIYWTSGSGSPEGVVTANPGSLYSRLDGGPTTTLYVKTSGAGNTGWTAK